MKQIYVLRMESGDPWARHMEDVEFSKNQKQLEDLAKRINKLDNKANAYVTELQVKDSLTKADINEIFRYHGLAN